MVSLSKLTVFVVFIKYDANCVLETYGSTSNEVEICLKKHRRRQTTFMARCMAELKARNKTWTLLIDVDEYISSDALDWGENAYNGMEPPPSAFPDFDKQKTIHEILKHKGETEPCFPFTRQLYSAKEDYNHTIWKDMAPNGFDDTNFVTLKYRWRALKNKVFVNRWQKTIVDVSRIPMESLVRQISMTVHLPLPSHCKADPRKFRTTLLRAVSIKMMYAAHYYEVCSHNIFSLSLESLR